MSQLVVDLTDYEAASLRGYCTLCAKAELLELAVDMRQHVKHGNWTDSGTQLVVTVNPPSIRTSRIHTLRSYPIGYRSRWGSGHDSPRRSNAD